ncbi:MAG: YbgC/FadM family acyl-CoA thioesterase [Microbacteriaceae bacterium]|nr:YbgC/FadM family acyl-CoA thioesterase [Burkholderiaceae bacterium]
MTTRSEFRFFERLRVRWAEVDLQKIVFNGHYLMYFDTAVAGWWRALALPYQETMAALDGDLYVRKASLEYEASARYDDLVDVGVRTARIGNSSLVLACAVFRGDQLLVSGELVYVFANPATRTSKPLPPDLRDLLQAFDTGQPMVDVRLGAWDTLGREAGAIRKQVFVEEQGIPAELEWDAADAVCLHAVAYNRFGVPLATGRLLEHEPGTSKIGRMAVLATLRGSRVGRAVLDTLMQAARARGDRQVLLHAQSSAAGFYRRAGFEPQGPEFEEAGIPHRAMVKAL